ncbi:hypothetical protein TIFTF001_050039 [Ficus carica]|uniref:Uncharacterized protein n=1 Tax=Ficus carica TaxID=3494 RepID=A0AA87YQK1_FICCA|nr:hypothetical protein TIFTF001_050039 [Ficus carica]
MYVWHPGTVVLDAALRRLGPFFLPFTCRLKLPANRYLLAYWQSILESEKRRAKDTRLLLLMNESVSEVRIEEQGEYVRSSSQPLLAFKPDPTDPSRKNTTISLPRHRAKKQEAVRKSPVYELTPQNKAATGDGSYPRELTIFVLKLKKEIESFPNTTSSSVATAAAVKPIRERPDLLTPANASDSSLLLRHKKCPHIQKEPYSAPPDNLEGHKTADYVDHRMWTIRSSPHQSIWIGTKHSRKDQVWGVKLHPAPSPGASNQLDPSSWGTRGKSPSYWKPIMTFVPPETSDLLPVPQSNSIMSSWACRASQSESKNRLSEEYDPKMVKKDRHYDDYYRDDYRRAGAKRGGQPQVWRGASPVPSIPKEWYAGLPQSNTLFIWPQACFRFVVFQLKKVVVFFSWILEKGGCWAFPALHDFLAAVLVEGPSSSIPE